MMTAPSLFSDRSDPDAPKGPAGLIEIATVDAARAGFP